MPTEWIDIADTAVKIGLGAIISGIATYRVARQNHDHEHKKDKIARRVDGIERAAADTDLYFDVFGDLIAITDGHITRFPNKKTFDLTDDVDIDLYRELRNVDDVFVSSRSHLSNAISRLHLLGLAEITVPLEEIQQIESNIRTEILFDLTLPTKDKLQTWRDDIKAAKLQFFEAIGDAYDS